MVDRLNAQQQRTLVRDGFVVVPGVIPQPMVDAARQRIYAGIDDGEPARGNEDVFIDLLHGTDVQPILEDALGPIVRSRGAQLVTQFPAEPSHRINEAGYPDRDTPFRGWHGHLDGLWNGATPIHQHVDRRMTPAEWEAWNQEPSRNTCRKSFPEANVNVQSFTVLVGIALSDQTAEGAGNLGLLRGAHHEIERFFRHQEAAGGPLGPDGPDWERIDTGAPNGAGLRHYPEAVREAFRPDGVETADGRFWPRPTLVKMAAGDAVLVLHAVPHGATRVTGSEPKLTAYFRVAPQSRPSTGRATYSRALVDIWHEWPGLGSVIDETRD